MVTKLHHINTLKLVTQALALVAQLVGALSCTPKCCEFDPQSGHIPGLGVQSLVGTHSGGNLSLSLSLSPPSSL